MTEDTLVQQTASDYLHDKLGWDAVYAYNEETLGLYGTLGRRNYSEVVLTRYLRAALVKFNEGLPQQIYEDAVRQIVEYPATQSVLQINQDKYALLKDGVLVQFRDEKGELIKRRLKVFDFEHPEENHFLAVRELWVKGALYRRRMDIMCFVNGIPLLFIELKNVHKNLQAAYEKNLKDYMDTIPQLFHHNAIIVIANGVEAKLGSYSSQYKHFLEWKRLEETEPGVVDMEPLLKGICDKHNFMDMFENFIVFDDSTGKLVKVLARNHQFLGVNRAIKAVLERKVRKGKLGIFWHTQGAGKSYSMVFFTRKIHRKLGGNFTFLVCTDRDDLDSQIYKTFAGCKLVDNDKDPCRPKDGEHLQQMLGEHKAYVFTLIQKFNKKIIDDPYSHRDDLIVITDEAHRTQNGIFARNMRDALTEASFIGFTGTPLFKDDEVTRRIFGDYVSTYDFQRAVEDGATVPLYYDARGEKLGIATNEINERIAQKLDEIEIEDINVSQRLEKELKREYHLITAQKRLDQIAADFVRHYSTQWENGKAMLICIDKITCVRMYDLIDHYWQQRLIELEKELPKALDDQDEIYRSRQIDWMKTTRMSVVVSEEQGEMEKFRKWDLDITPHRQLIKQGFETQDGKRLDIDMAFKKEEHPFRIAIVCAMWLTGFDVPSLATLYLDKPLKAHTLMQAIARANRVNEGKNNGLIVDYCGILKNLRKALATFAGHKGDNGGRTQPGVDPVKPADEELLGSLEEAITIVRGFLETHNFRLENVLEKTGFERNKSIADAKEIINRNDETRKRFEIMAREVFKKFKACINIKSASKYREQYDAVNIIYNRLQIDREQADITDIIRQLHEVVDAAIDIKQYQTGEPDHNLYDISKIDFDRLRREFERCRNKNTTVANLKDAIEKRLDRMIQQNPLRTDFQEHYEKIVAEYNSEKDRFTIEKTFEDLMRFVKDLDHETQRTMREGLDEENLALFDLLVKPGLSKKDIERTKKVAIDLLARLKVEKLLIDNWREKEATRDSIKIEIHNCLYNDVTGLPESYTEDEISQKTEVVFAHIFRVYNTANPEIYATALAQIV